MTKEGSAAACSLLAAQFPNYYNKMTKREKLNLVDEILKAIPVSDDLVIDGVREGLKKWRFPPIISEIINEVGRYSDKMYLWYRSFKDMGLEWKGVGKDYFPTVRGLDDLYGRVG